MASTPSMSAEKMTDRSQGSLNESRKNTRRMRRRREPQDSAATPTTSVPSTPKNKQIDADYDHKQSQEATTSSNVVTNGSTTFEEGEDFIPFVISGSSDDDEPGPSRRRRRTDRTSERRREAEKTSDRDDTNGRQLSERQAMSNGDFNDVPTSDRVKGKSKMSESEREWDRGKEVADVDKHDRRNGNGRDRKRKYDEHDDRYSNHKPRVEVGLRKCPWVAHLDLDHCSNVAEM